MSPDAITNEDEERSGRLILRLPKSLHARLHRASDKEGVSINQYITMVLAEAVALSERMGAKVGDVAPVTDPTRAEKETTVYKAYGDRRRSFIVTAGRPGWIRLWCCTANQTVREVIRSHQSDPLYFLDHLDVYRKGHFRAHHWLAKVVDDFGAYFESGHVEIILDADCESLDGPTGLR